jgi:hypothetical protein
VISFLSLLLYKQQIPKVTLNLHITRALTNPKPHSIKPYFTTTTQLSPIQATSLIMPETTTSTTFPVCSSPEEFLAEGFELTIIEAHGEQDECPICYRPIYKAECDGNTNSHIHEMCGTSEKKPQPPRSPSDPYPEPGLRLKRCGHVIGYTCAMAWFERSNTCPMCRAALYVVSWVEEETDDSEFDWDEESDSDDETEPMWLPGEVAGVPGEYFVSEDDIVHWRPIGQHVSTVRMSEAPPYLSALYHAWHQRSA